VMTKFAVWQDTIRQGHMVRTAASITLQSVQLKTHL
jgi:hypothetical protein